MPDAGRASTTAEKCAHYWARPQHAVTYPRMSERQKAAQADSIENLRLAIQMQKTRKARK